MPAPNNNMLCRYATEITQQRQAEDVAEDEQAAAEERNSPRDPRSSRTRKCATLTVGRTLQWLCNQLLAPACSMQDDSMRLTMLGKAEQRKEVSGGGLFIRLGMRVLVLPCEHGVSHAQTDAAHCSEDTLTPLERYCQAGPVMQAA